jgi:aminoglycoside 3-N-acetyltransferase
VFTYAVSHTIFDPVRSRSRTGIVTEFFRRQPGVRRSGNPTHSVAASGRYAREITQGSPLIPPYDRRGPFGKLAQHKAKIIFLGCRINVNSMFHAIEDWNRLPFLQIYPVRMRAGQRVKKVLFKNMPVGHRDFYEQSEQHMTKIYQKLFARKLVRAVRVGQGKIHLMESDKLITACHEILQDDPNVFLCDRKECEFCRKYRTK